MTRSGFLGCLRLCAVACFGLTAVVVSSFCDDGSWKNLQQVNRRSDLIFFIRSGNCIGGRIKAFNDASITVLRPNKSEVVILRTELSRASWGSWAGGVLFSARSSWSDVVNLVGKYSHPEVIVRSESGQEFKGKLISASTTALVLQTAQKSATIPKTDIAQVNYLREKPASTSAVYADDELAFFKVFDPELWPHMLHLQGTFSIRLYDKSLPEDDSPAVCKSPPWQGALQGDLDLTKAPPQ